MKIWEAFVEVVRSLNSDLAKIAVVLIMASAIVASIAVAGIGLSQLRAMLLF